MPNQDFFLRVLQWCTMQVPQTQTDKWTDRLPSILSPCHVVYDFHLPSKIELWWVVTVISLWSKTGFFSAWFITWPTSWIAIQLLSREDLRTYLCTLIKYQWCTLDGQNRPIPSGTGPFINLGIDIMSGGFCQTHIIFQYVGGAVILWLSIKGWQSFYHL